MDFEFKPRGSSKYVEKRFPREKTLMRRKNQEILDRKQRKYRDQKIFSTMETDFSEGCEEEYEFFHPEIYQSIKYWEWFNEQMEEFNYQRRFMMCHGSPRRF